MYARDEKGIQMDQIDRIDSNEKDENGLSSSW